MSKLNDKDRNVLLKLARSAITAKLVTREQIIKPKKISLSLKEKTGCFVTLHKKGMLRGCIGMIEPLMPLIDGVEENALNAAFKDPRFPPLHKDELPDIDIEISILTKPEKIEFKDAEDLKSNLKPGIHGVILSHGWHSATFLPQVWDQLPDKEIFLAHLCQKGGMKINCWQNPEAEIKVYEVEYFSEHQLYHP